MPPSCKTGAAFNPQMRGFSWPLLMALAACGGGGGNGFEEAVGLADAKEAQARALAAESPCSSAAQCDNLAFPNPAGSYGGTRFKPYSLVSPTAAAASAAAAEQQELARRARNLAPPSNVACPQLAPLPPALACRASVCQVQ